MDAGLKRWLRETDTLPRAVREIVLGLAARGHLAHSTSNLTSMASMLGLDTVPGLVALFRQLWSAQVIDWVRGYWVLARRVTRALLQPPASPASPARAEVAQGEPAPPRAPRALPPGWICRLDSSGRVVYWDLRPHGRGPCKTPHRHPPGRPLPLGWHETILRPTATVAYVHPASGAALQPAGAGAGAAAGVGAPAVPRRAALLLTTRGAPPSGTPRAPAPAPARTPCRQECPWTRCGGCGARPAGAMFRPLAAALPAPARRPARAPPPRAPVAIHAECGLRAAGRAAPAAAAYGPQRLTLPTGSLRWVRPAPPRSRCGRLARRCRAFPLAVLRCARP